MLLYKWLLIHKCSYLFYLFGMEWSCIYSERWIYGARISAKGVDTFSLAEGSICIKFRIISWSRFCVCLAISLEHDFEQFSDFFFQDQTYKKSVLSLFFQLCKILNQDKPNELWWKNAFLQFICNIFWEMKVLKKICSGKLPGDFNENKQKPMTFCRFHSHSFLFDRGEL